LKQAEVTVKDLLEKLKIDSEKEAKTKTMVKREEAEALKQ